MLRYRTGVAGSGAAGKAIATYLTSETLRPENEALAKYYVGESIPETELSGMEHLGHAIANGDVSFSEALHDLMRAHIHLFGAPEDIDGLEERLSQRLADLAGRAEMREAVAEEGGTVACIRDNLHPALAKRLGIDTSRPLTQGEIANLLTGLRTDGEVIEGRQVHKPMQSVAAVFGLDEKRLPAAEHVEHVLTGRRIDGQTPIGPNGSELSAEAVKGAQKRFLAAYGVPSGQEPTDEQIDHIKAGRMVTGVTAGTSDVTWKLNATRAPVAFIDMIWSADKSVSAAFALANTEAERFVIKHAHDEAVGFAMSYAEDRLAFTRRGKDGKDGVEKGVTCWIGFNHYTARPTAEIALTDEATGQRYTEF